MLGKKIKKYLEANGISQSFLSGKTGIKISTLNQMLNGIRNIKAEEYFTICSALGLSTEFFANGRIA